jgi:hypothetical protein
MTREQSMTDQEADSLFAADQESDGYVANLTRLFAYRSEVYRAWFQLNMAIKANMGPAPLRARHHGGRAAAAIQLLRAR